MRSLLRGKPRDLLRALLVVICLLIVYYGVVLYDSHEYFRNRVTLHNNRRLLSETRRGHKKNSSTLPHFATTTGKRSLNDTKLVLLVSYQRSGSTFVSDILFNNNPKVFNIYEPLDQLYASMYGVPPGWTVPTDITTYEDGRYRTPQAEEIETVSWMLEQIFTCQMTSLPPSVLMHPFWTTFSSNMNSVKPFVSCLGTGRLADTSLKNCQFPISRFCGSRFGEPNKWKSQEKCRGRLWKTRAGLVGNLTFWSEDRPKKGSMLKGKQSSLSAKNETLRQRFTTYEAIRFAKYDNCLQLYESHIRSCVSLLEDPCRASPVRAIKTVRATMESVEPLLEKFPQLKVIHLYRDPRAVTLSRSKANWSLGIFDADGSAKKVARAYCQTVLNDLIKSKRLQKQFPGRIKTLVYDDMVQDIKKSVQDISEFLNLNVLDVEHLKYSLDLESLLKWKMELPETEVQKIREECEDFAKEGFFNWSR